MTPTPTPSLNRPVAAMLAAVTGATHSTLTAQVTLLYGPTGTYKTTQVGKFAEYIGEVTEGRITRVVSAESAGAEPLHPYIETGMIEVLWLSRSMKPRSALRKLSRGEWPKFGPDGIPERDQAGRLVWLQPGATGNDLSRVGGYAFEGLTSFADILGQDMKATFASGAAVSGDKKEGAGLAGAGYTEENENFGSGSQSQVGGVQDSIMELLREAPKNLYERSKGQIVHVLFTAHESKGQDDMTGQATYGPGTIGKAITGKLFKEVGTALHLEAESVAVAADTKTNTPAHTRVRVWAYYQKHPDSENPMVKWECKPRIPATREAHEEMQRLFPGGRFELTFDQSIADYLKFQDRVHKKAMEQLAAAREAFVARQGGAGAATATAPAPTPAAPAKATPAVAPAPPPSTPAALLKGAPTATTVK